MYSQMFPILNYNIILMHYLCFTIIDCELNLNFSYRIQKMLCYVFDFFFNSESQKAVREKNSDQAQSQTFKTDWGKYLRSWEPEVSEFKVSDKMPKQ